MESMSAFEAITTDPRVQAEAATHPYPLLFATVSGAHLYGFPSPDSDVDLRGVHVLPPRELLGLDTGPETIERSHVREFQRLVEALQAARDAPRLPDLPSMRPALHDLLLRVRLAGV